MRVLKPILRNLLLAPRAIRVVDDQKTWRGYEIYVAALHLARAIERATDRPHVGFMLPTSGLSPVAIVAGWMLGRTVVPLNYLLKPDERAFILEDAEVDAVVTVGPMLEQFGALPSGVHGILLDELSMSGFPPLRRSVRRPDDALAVLMYTSGTSGVPKGVMLTSGNLASNVRQCIDWAGFTARDVLLGVLPQFHSFGLTVLTLMPLTRGCRVVYTARFNPRRILKLMETHRATAIVAIPSMYNALLSSKSAKREQFESLKWIVSGGEPLPEAIFTGFADRFGITINEGYGLTETGPVTNWCRPQDHKPRSVGRPLPGIEEKIVSPNGERLSVGEDGEICISGPNVMVGYYKRPDETKQVFDDEGFFRTGDMGRLDEDGHLFITGRIKEMLIIGGENVFPREIEEVLNRHPSVHDSAVIAMQDESRGEIPLAFVEMEEGADFDEQALRAHCREHLPQFKVPREIRVLDALPRNATGKIMRRELSADVVRT